MARIVRLFLVVLCVAGWTTSQVRSAVTDEGTANAGPVRFSVGFGGEYTDNRDSLPHAEDNYDLYISPRLDSVLDFENTILDFYYAPTYRYRSDPSSIQNDSELFHNLGIDVSHKVSDQAKLGFKELFNYTDDPSVQANGALLSRDSSFIYNRAHADFNYQLSDRRNNILLAVDNMLKRYDDSIRADESDEDSIAASATGSHKISRTLDVLASAEFASWGFKNASIDFDRDFNTLNGNVGIRNTFSDYVQGEIRAGFVAVDYKESSFSSKTEPSYSIGVTVTPSPRSRLYFDAQHVERESTAYPFPSQEYSSGFTKIEWDATKSVSLGATGEYRSGKYSDNEITSVGRQYLLNNNFKTSGDEITIVSSIYGTYKLGNNTSIRLSQSYEDVDSDVGYSFTRNATQLALTRSF